jgi:transposase
MKKKLYRASQINQVNFEAVAAKVTGEKVVFGVDVAKVDFFGALMKADREVVSILKWKQLPDTEALMKFLKALPVSSLEVAAESSGTYGDPLVNRFKKENISVFLVGAKRSKDAQEVYDGVPSSHDAKSATIIANLHWEGCSNPWPEKSEAARDLAAKLDIAELYSEPLYQHINRLEARLSRCWPEYLDIMTLNTASALGLLKTFGGPAPVALDPQRAIALLRSIGRNGLDEKKVEAAVASAKTTIGVSMRPLEQEALKVLATEADRYRRLTEDAEKEIKAIINKQEELKQLTQTVGAVTAAAITVDIGNASDYSSAGAFLKAAGLNLKEKSSGMHKGQLSITKRGPSRVRFYLYMLAMRFVHKDPIVKAWYAKMVARHGSRSKNAALVAVMRKLLKALWHVGRGAVFNSALLFDTRILDI